MASTAPGLGTEVTVVVCLLGGFRLRRSGRPMPGLPRASQRLLAFLALYAQVVNRATIAGTLWPEASERHAYANLRSALVRLDRGCRGLLQASRLELRLAEGVTVDIRHARALARRLLDPESVLPPADLGSDTLAVLSAELLPGWYDDWVLSEAEDWRQLRLHALEGLADRLTASGRWGEAAGAAWAAVRAEPLRESATAALIRVHLAEGTSPRWCASSTATGRCWKPSSGSSPPRGCAAWCGTWRSAAGNAGVALASRRVITLWPAVGSTPGGEA